jgi:hypothetical protein
MRTQGTKYDKVAVLDAGAMPVREYARRNNISSPAYVHVKYDRYKFGYKTAAGKDLHGPYPGYDIIEYFGACYVTEPN